MRSPRAKFEGPDVGGEDGFSYLSAMNRNTLGRPSPDSEHRRRDGHLLESGAVGKTARDRDCDGHKTEAVLVAFVLY